jgi:hypothetical protein
MYKGFVCFFLSACSLNTIGCAILRLHSVLTVASHIGMPLLKHIFKIWVWIFWATRAAYIFTSEGHFDVHGNNLYTSRWSKKHALQYISCLMRGTFEGLLLPWRWRKYVPLKCWYSHGIVTCWNTLWILKDRLLALPNGQESEKRVLQFTRLAPLPSSK